MSSNLHAEFARRHNLHQVSKYRPDKDEALVNAYPAGVFRHRNSVDHDVVFGVVHDREVVLLKRQLRLDLPQSKQHRRTHHRHDIAVISVPCQLSIRFMAIIKTIASSEMSLYLSHVLSGWSGVDVGSYHVFSPASTIHNSEKLLRGLDLGIYAVDAVEMTNRQLLMYYKDMPNDNQALENRVQNSFVLCNQLEQWSELN